MPNIKSAKKRVEVNLRNEIRNKARKSKVRTAIRKFETTLAKEGSATAAPLLRESISQIDRAVAKGVLHPNTAARRKSKIARELSLTLAK